MIFAARPGGTEPKAFSQKTKHKHQPSSSPRGTKSPVTQLPRGRNIYRRTWLTVVLILDPNPVPPSLPSFSYILKSSSLLSGEPGLRKPLSLLLQLSSTPLTHISSPSLLPNPNCFLHSHFHVILLLLKKHFTPFLNFLLNSDLFLLSPQSNKERLFDTDCEKKFTQPGLHANGKCLSVSICHTLVIA